MQEQMEILSNREIATNIYEMVLTGSLLQKLDQAGQFVHVKVPRHDLILRRPISIAAFNEHSMTLIYRVVGAGTESLANMKSRQTLDVLGPLGHGFDISMVTQNNRVLCIGGGIGVAPLYELAKQLNARGASLHCILGFANAQDIFYEQAFQELGDLSITTDDGSRGIRGNVSKAFRDIEYTAIYACGPVPLLHCVREKYQEHKHVYLSLEQRMACGMGACYGCETKTKNARICKDGPVFHAKEMKL